MKKLSKSSFLFVLVHLFGIGIPILLIANRYDLFRKVSENKLAVGGVIVLIILSYYIKGELRTMISNMANSPTKIMMQYGASAIPLLVIFFVLVFAKSQVINHLDNLIFISWWWFVSHMVSIYFRVRLFKVV